MIRFFLEQVAALEMALLVTVVVILVSATVGFVIWLRTRKSKSRKSAGAA